MGWELGGVEEFKGLRVKELCSNGAMAELARWSEDSELRGASGSAPGIPFSLGFGAASDGGCGVVDSAATLVRLGALVSGGVRLARTLAAPAFGKAARSSISGSGLAGSSSVWLVARASRRCE